MDDDELKRRGEGSTPVPSTSASIESARRFLYDEDEPPPGNPANTHLPSSNRTSLSADNLGGDISKTRHRLNPVVAAFMATLNTCRSFGLKRILVVGGGAAVILFLALGISARVGGYKSEPTNLTRTNEISKKITDSGLTSKSALEDTSTPQFHALSWLANVDDTHVTSSFLMQRYALAVFFYSTSLGTTDHVNPKSGWHKQDNWMTSTGYCTWYGIECSMEKSSFSGDSWVTAIVLPGNKLKGGLTNEIAALTKLITFDIVDNSIADSLPRAVSQLPELGYLLLGKNEIWGSIPSEYGHIASLREIDLGHNQLTGTFPPGLPRNPLLRKLGLEHNNFTGHLPNMSQVRHLVSLYLQGNNFNSTIPASFTHMTSLTDLRISDNRIEGTLPTALHALTRLEIFYASNNNFEGVIPADLFTSLTRLSELSLGKNRLTSTLPTTMGRMGDLKLFSVANNKLIGTIPRQLGILLDLETLEIQENQFSGALPDLIVSMKDLEVIKAHNNQLAGSVPSGLGVLRKLVELHLAQNNFSGAIPTELGKLKELKMCRLDGNQLTGSMPSQVCDLVNDNSLAFLSSDCTSGIIQCTCCHTCS